MAVKSYKCRNCGALVAGNAQLCAYCGVGVEESLGRETRLTLEPGAGEFGFPKAAAVGGILAVVIYSLGWLFEDSAYWLADRTLLVWLGVLPVWLLLVRFVWRARWGGWLVGAAGASLLFVSHLTAMWLLADRLRDNHIGIAAMFSGAALSGWCVGRLLHILVRRSRAQAGINGD